MELIFTSTQYLKKSVSLINQLDSSKFSPLLLRIVQKIHVKDEVSFTTVELEKLQKTLNMSRTEVEDVIGACEFIFQQAAYHAVKPAVLDEQLRRLGLSDDKVDVVVDLWKKSAADVLSGLRQHTLPAAQVSSVSWQLCVTMCEKHSATASQRRRPTAVMQLNIDQQTPTDNEKVVMEMSHDELYKLYNQLELIQSQLDALR